MTGAALRRLLRGLADRESLNFWITNRIPRRALTFFVGWISRSERPLVRDVSLAIWRTFDHVDLADARETEFRSMHEVFTRALRDGARPADPRPWMLASPSDGIVGACGRVEEGTLLQAKGSRYELADLLAGDVALADHFRGGTYATLRLTSGMYHRFHAPLACRVRRVAYVAGDAWNVNPPALRHVPRLFCRNERAVLRCEDSVTAETIALVPVAAVLVASIRLRFIDVRLHLRYRGPNVIECDATLRKGEEMGWFEHGSTIIVLAPPTYALAESITEGVRIRAGQALFSRAQAAAAGPA